MKEIKLFNPNNWTFLGFFLTPIVPWIFIYKNKVALGESKKARHILYTGLFLVLSIIGLDITIFITMSPENFLIYSQISALVVFVATYVCLLIQAKKEKDKYDNLDSKVIYKPGKEEAPYIIPAIIILVFLYFSSEYFSMIQ